MARRNQTPSYAQRQADQRRNAAEKESNSFYNKANDVRWNLDEKLRSAEERAAKEAHSAAAEIDRDGEKELRRLLSQTVQQWSGGIKKRTVIWHWRTPNPTLERKDVGPLYMIPRDPSYRQQGQAATENPKFQSLLRTPEGQEWAKSVHAAIAEMRERYPFLPKLCREREWLGEKLHRAGVTETKRKPDTVQTEYGAVDRTIEIIRVPVLDHIEIGEEGLVLVFEHHAGDNAQAWASKVPALRNIFRSVGVDATRLHVTDGLKDGSVRLEFSDAPSAFPPAVAPWVTEPVQSVAEAHAKYQDFRWPLGLDARGNVIAPSIKEVYHVLAVGGTGSGKSVWMRGLIESARLSGFKVFLVDGKQADYPALQNSPGVVMRSSDAAQHVVLIAKVLRELEKRQAISEQRKAEGHPDPYDFDPILLVADEFASVRDDVLALFDGKANAMKPWLNAIAAIARKGRQMRVHMVLASQDLYVENIPNQWQGNFQLLVSLGEIEDKTLDTKFIPEKLKDEAKRVGSKITRKNRGRGLFVDKVDAQNIKIVEFQSFYSFSPGSTSLAEDAPPDAAPPTEEVRAVWQQQLRASEQMPRLYSRLGIKVEDSDWAKDSDVAKGADCVALMNTPTITLDDKNAGFAPIPERVQYDHRTPQWLGRESVGAPSIDLDDDDDDFGLGAAQAPVTETEAEAEELSDDELVSNLDEAMTKVKAESAPPAKDPKEMTPEEKHEEIKRLARLAGHHVPGDDAETVQAEAEEEHQVIAPKLPPPSDAQPGDADKFVDEHMSSDEKLGDLFPERKPKRNTKPESQGDEW